MTLINILIAIFSIFLIGYALGRRIGIKQGKKKGRAIEALQSKEVLYKSGRCPICHKCIED